MAQVPWGTWRRDFQFAPGGEIRFDHSLNAGVLTARRDEDLVWIKRPFAGAKAGYQIRFRLGPGGSPRLAVAFSFARWLEIRGGGADLFRVAADETAERMDAGAFPAAISGGVVAVVPRSPDVLVFLDDRLLYALPESEWPHADGLQVGAGGGTVFIESVRVKDRSR
jgi:hypothetical protein